MAATTVFTPGICTLDNDPHAQTEKAGLSLVIEPMVNVSGDVVAEVKPGMRT